MRCQVKHARLIFWLTLILAIAGETAPTDAGQDGPEIVAKPVNVLFIAVDDLRPELGCYGVEYAQSPHIDALAKRSLSFSNHFVQVPTCGASRYALLTGQSPISSGGLRNDAFYNGETAINPNQLGGAQTFPEMFRRSGYRTVCIGKISHTADGRVFEYDGTGNGRMEIPQAWDDLATPFGNWKRGWGIFFAYANGVSREDGSGHRDLMEFTAQQDDDLPDGQMATAAIAKLKDLKQLDQPFFMGLGFFKPHLPFVAPQKDWEAFEGVEIPLPRHGKISASQYANYQSKEFFKYDFPYHKTRPLDDEKVLINRRAYLACLRYTDRQIGRVLKSLNDEGLTDSTIVVLWSDHGWNLGDSRQWAKHTALERAVRSPMMICVPGMKSAGMQSDSLVETIDLFPTLIDLCQPAFAKTEKQLDGKSLIPILDDPKTKIKEVSFSYWRDSVSVRSKDFRLIAKIKDQELGELDDIELYSAEQEFDPIMNLADQHPDVVSRLARKFKTESLKTKR